MVILYDLYALHVGETQTVLIPLLKRNTGIRKVSEYERE